MKTIEQIEKIKSHPWVRVIEGMEKYSDGFKASIERKTLWGELADNLGSYGDFEAEDSEMHPVRDIGKIKALFKEPTLHSLITIVAGTSA
jgi:hypothetical protein